MDGTQTDNDPTTDPPGPDLAGLVASMPLATLLGVELTSARADEVTGELAWREPLCTVAGAMHGGAVMAFADSLGAVCAYLNLAAGEGTSTIDSSTNFFRGLRRGRLHGVSRPLHVGRTTIVVQTDLHDDDGRHIARVTQTQVRLGPA